MSKEKIGSIPRTSKVSSALSRIAVLPRLALSLLEDPPELDGVEEDWEKLCSFCSATNELVHSQLKSRTAMELGDEEGASRDRLREAERAARQSLVDELEWLELNANHIRLKLRYEGMWQDMASVLVAVQTREYEALRGEEEEEYQMFLRDERSRRARLSFERNFELMLQEMEATLLVLELKRRTRLIVTEEKQWTLLMDWLAKTVRRPGTFHGKVNPVRLTRPRLAPSPNRAADAAAPPPADTSPTFRLGAPPRSPDSSPPFPLGERSPPPHGSPTVPLSPSPSAPRPPPSPPIPPPPSSPDDTSPKLGARTRPPKPPARSPIAPTRRPLNVSTTLRTSPSSPSPTSQPPASTPTSQSTPTSKTRRNTAPPSPQLRDVVARITADRQRAELEEATRAASGGIPSSSSPARSTGSASPPTGGLRRSVSISSTPTHVATTPLGLSPSTPTKSALARSKSGGELRKRVSFSME